MMRIVSLAGLCIILMTGYSAEPLYQWTFDDHQPQTGVSYFGLRNYTDGVSGKALIFDGYSTAVTRSGKMIEMPGHAFTITAWVAPQEYSWNLTAIINQQENFKKGYFFGIDYRGKLVGALSVDSGWKSCISNESLPLLKWSHVSMTFDARAGIQLFINGEKAGELSFSGNPVYAGRAAISIGKTQTPMTPANTERATSRAVLSWIYFDGLIDELRIYGSALSADQIRENDANTKIAEKQPLEFRRLPSGTDQPRPFGAYYTKLTYSPGWDARWHGSDLPDIVVRFDNSPVKLVFWRGTGYIPAMVTENGIWMADQSGENFGSGECFEAMGDKQCRYSHVRIIENTPARAVIHWRYALSSISHKIMNETDINPGDWMDEYWTVYPDAIVVRNQVLWSKFEKPGQYQFQETIFFNQPGTKPQENVNDQAITFMDMHGSKASYSWETGAPKSFPQPQFKPVEMINTRSKYKPYRIFHPERVTQPFGFGWVKGYSTFPCWNHWPVQQIPSDGRKAVAPDKPSHSSLTAVNGDRQILEKFPDGSIRVRALWGMTTDTIDSLLPVARSWNNPAQAVSVSPGYTCSGYDAYQRAYLFEKDKDTANSLKFDLKGTKESPLVNFAAVVKNWGEADAKIQRDGRKLSQGKDYRIGHRRTLNGTDLVVWIEMSSEESTQIIMEPTVSISEGTAHPTNDCTPYPANR